MEKVIVDKDSCIGCGMCIQNSPEYFVFDDEGHAEAIDVELKSSDKQDILDRVDECPGQAIRVEEVKGECCGCKVQINKDSCIGCGMCAGDNPDYFEIGDDGYANVKKSEVNSEDKESVESTANNCPGGAIETK